MTDPHDGVPPTAAIAEPPAPAAGPAGPEPAPAGVPVAAPEPAASPDAAPSPDPVPNPAAASGSRPTFLFFGGVAAVSLVLDVVTKAWAEITLSPRALGPNPSMELIKDHLSFTLAYNKGGAWGILQEQPEYVRRPFFLLVSLLAIAFIINLYGRLTPGQRALKWGLPLVLGGALGNLADRMVRSNVIDFIDYQAKWIESMNRAIGKVQKGWAITDHWPTFNVADIAICVGVGLMAVDMFTSRRGATASLPPGPAAAPVPPGASVGPAALPETAALPEPPGAPQAPPQATPPLKPDA